MSDLACPSGSGSQALPEAPTDLRPTGFDPSRKRHLRVEQYPILPDFENDHYGLDLAQDGRPWRKVCKECAFRTNDPQGMGYDYQERAAYCNDDVVFYCVHRDDDGLTRICACWAALRTRIAPQGIAARSVETHSGSAEGKSPVAGGDAP